MLDTNDIKQIRQVIKEEISGTETRLRGEITGTETKLMKEISGTETRLRGEITGTETRLRGEIKESEKMVTKNLTKVIEETEQRIYHGIGDVISDSLLPMLNEKVNKKDLAILEKRVGILEQNSSVVQ